MAVTVFWKVRNSLNFKMRLQENAMDNNSFEFIQIMTREHRAIHGCGAYVFKDGPGLTALTAAHDACMALELGTALGYTACCIAAGTPKTQVDTIEMDAEHVRLARENISKAKLSDRVRVHQGDFAAVMSQLPGNYDLIFFDGFAPELRILRLLRTKLRDGGLLVCSNLSMARDDGKAELDDEAKWKPAGSIEGGGTRAFIKRVSA
jgi:predicted O-methyltransferase YrrM